MNTIPKGTGFTQKSIVSGEKPVKLIIHDTDGTWQFLDGGPARMEDAMIVHAHHILKDYPEMRGLLPGEAAERKDENSDWEYFWTKDDDSLL